MYLGEEGEAEGNQKKVKNGKAKKKYVEKKQVEEDNSKQKIEMNNRELNENLKLIVFDLNKTLVAKRK